MTCLTSLNFCLVTTPFSRQHLLSSLNPTSFSTSLNFWWLKIRPREHRVHEELPSARGRHEHELLYVGTRSQWSTAQQVYTIYTTQDWKKKKKHLRPSYCPSKNETHQKFWWIFPVLSWMNCHTLTSCSSAWNSWLRPCSATFWSTTCESRNDMTFLHQVEWSAKAMIKIGSDCSTRNDPFRVSQGKSKTSNLYEIYFKCWSYDNDFQFF